MTTRTLTGCRICWDTQDPQNEGWAYHVYYSDGHEDSGPWDWPLAADCSETELAEAVVSLAHQHGETIQAGDVAYEPHDGGSAEWSVG